jgi:hypothetical protein
LESERNNTDTQKLTAFTRLAELAPSLSNAAVKLLIAIINAADPPSWRVKASQAELAAIAGSPIRSNVRSIAQLTKAGLLEINHGRQHQANIFHLAAKLTSHATAARLTQTSQTGTADPTQPSQTGTAEIASHANVARLDSQPSQLGTAKAAQPGQTGTALHKERAPAPTSPARVENYREVLEKDRSRATALEILRADPSAYAPEDHAHVAQRIASHQAKHGTRVPDQPPDLTITAQILAAAGSKFDRIMDYLRDSAIRPGDVWPWYVSVMAERCAGIGRKQFSAARKELRSQSQRHPAPPATHANPYCGEDGKPDMAAIAKLKRMTS